MTRRGSKDPPPLPRPARRRAPSADELELWRTVLRDVAPLPGRSAPPAPAPKPPSAKPADLKASTASVPPAVPSASPMPLPGPPARPGLDRGTAERLRRGKMAIDARIDLHGLTQAEAHDALLGMVRRGWETGRRVLLVITGKGDMAIGGGVLRTSVPRWLREPPVRDKILAVEPAQPRHGGSGAYYVLLRRRRET